MVRRASPLAVLLWLASAGALAGSPGCSAPDRRPARRTTARPAPARFAPVRPSAPSITVHPLWEAKTGQQQARLAQVKSGCVLVLAGPYLARGTPQRELLCLAPKNGEVRWRWRGGQAPLEVAATHSHVVTLRDAAGKHHFVDARTGRKVDRPKGRLPAPRTAPLVVDGHRYTVEGHTVRCADAQTGTPIWESPTRGPATGLRVAGRTIYYAVGGERAIHARNARSGLGLWLHQVRPLRGVKHPRAVNFSFAVAHGRLFVARYDGTVGAFSLRKSGKSGSLTERVAPHPRARRGSVVPAGIPRSYVVCGCGCCGGLGTTGNRPKVCLFWSRGQDIRKLIAQDRQAKKNPQCAVMGCSLGTWYAYCD